MSSLSTVYSPETESLSEHKYQVGQLVNERHLSPHTTARAKDICSPALPCLSVCAVYLNSGPHNCRASTLTH